MSDKNDDADRGSRTILVRNGPALCGAHTAGAPCREPASIIDECFGLLCAACALRLDSRRLRARRRHVNETA